MDEAAENRKDAERVRKGLVYPVFFQFIAEGGEAQPKLFGGLGSIPGMGTCFCSDMEETPHVGLEET